MGTDNQIPQIIQDLTRTVTDKNVPRFQRDIAAQTLERVLNTITIALNVYRRGASR